MTETDGILRILCWKCTSLRTTWCKKFGGNSSLTHFGGKIIGVGGGGGGIHTRKIPENRAGIFCSNLPLKTGSFIFGTCSICIMLKIRDLKWNGKLCTVILLKFGEVSCNTYEILIASVNALAASKT